MDKIQLIKTLYFRQKFGKDAFDDKLIKILKNETTGEKFHEVVDDPMITFYVNKEDEFLETPVTFIEPDRVDTVKCNYRNLLKQMAYELDEQEFLQDCFKSGKPGYARKMHLNANVHASDMDIQDIYIAKHYDNFPMNESANKLTKSYFDIEVDGVDNDGFPDEHVAPCPVNAITHFDAETMTCYTLLLENSANPLIEEFVEELEEFKAELVAKYKEEYSLDIKFKIVMYDENDEISLIADYFALINHQKPDFALAWNIKFDFLTLYNRIINLGYEVEDIMCSEDIPYRQCYMYEDGRHQDPADKTDYIEVSNHTVFKDQMLLFANLRKIFGKRESYALDAICETEIDEQKLTIDPDNEGINIKNFPWKNYRRFVEYNIHDVILLYILEEKNQDIEMLYMVSAMTQTRINHTLKKTVCLKNLASKFIADQGYIMSNNRNQTYGADRPKSEKFRGAFVANPLLNAAMGKLINGLRSRFIHENVIDMDLSSLYPSIILAFNIDVSTQLGKLILLFPDKIPSESALKEFLNTNEIYEYDDNIRSLDCLIGLMFNHKDVYVEALKKQLIPEDEGYKFIDTFISNDWIHIGMIWFGLPSVEEMMQLVDIEIGE